MECHLLLPVWGEDYIKRFLRVTLPSLLAPGNLPCLSDVGPVFHVFSRSAELSWFEQAPSFQALSRIMETRLHPMDDLEAPNAYVTMTRCHERGLAFGPVGQTCYFFVPPDCVWSEKSFAALKAACAAGKKAILLAGVRLRSHEMMKALAAFQTEQVLRISSRALVRLALEALHPMAIAFLSDDGRFRAIQNLYWEVPGEGLLARCFHLHPIMVRPRERIQLLRGSIDDDLVPRVCSDYHDFHIVTDSDEACMFELSHLHHGGEVPKLAYYSAGQIREWIRTTTHLYHRKYIRSEICLHATDLSEKWASVRAEADRLVETVFNPDDIQNDYHVNTLLQPNGSAFRRALQLLKGLSKKLYHLMFWPLLKKIASLGEEKTRQEAEIQSLKNALLCLERQLKRSA